MELQLYAMNPFYLPSKNTLEVLNERKWISSYSGGKDSTSLVTWIEYLRRIGMVKVKTPRLVLSDTEVEYPFLQEIATRIMAEMKKSGWKCEVVRPPIHKKLYNSIFGRGLPPVHPSHTRKLRWCTNATKVGPMQQFSRSLSLGMINLSGVRWGESKVRDDKLSVGGCHAGGECGLPPPGEEVYGPIITWKTCQVLEWLQGKVSEEINEVISDLLPLTRELITVYGVKKLWTGFDGAPPKFTSLRFGCIGCPAVSTDKVMESSLSKYPQWRVLRRLYGLWDKCRDKRNRVKKEGREKDGTMVWGPIKMEVRKLLFPQLIAIQEKAGITLVTPEDIGFIHDCWEKKVYPRGWSWENEK